MGCSIGVQTISKRLIEIERRAPTVAVNVVGETHHIDALQHCIGLFYAQDITDSRYRYYEHRFIVLSRRRLKKSKNRVSFASKEALVASIISAPDLFNDYISIVRRKGLDQVYRWSFYKVFIGCNERAVIDLPRRERLHEQYFALMASPNPDAENIIRKDVRRTAVGDQLYVEEQSVGAVLIARVCKGIAGLFPQAGYVQGLNFIVHFALSVSGLNELETFVFLAQLFSKEKNLYFGFYDAEFTLVRFSCFCFHTLLAQRDRKLSQAIGAHLPDELYLSKWLLTFFCSILTKPFLLRVWDFIVISDVFSMVFVALEIVEQVRKVLLKQELEVSAGLLGAPEELCRALDYRRFIKRLKVAYAQPPAVLLDLVTAYQQSLSGQQLARFEPYAQVLRRRLSRSYLRVEGEFAFANAASFK